MRYFIFFLICFLSAQGASQCGLTKTHIIKDVVVDEADTTNISILVTGAINNNLATNDQGLCGVQLKFRHAFMKEMYIELISPSGKKITLVGGDIVATNTPFITWDVTFVPLLSTPSPDPGFLPKWENDQVWQSFTTYTGQYHPHIGNLEDFNQGPVNGNWTLRCIDFLDETEGVLLGASLIFCQEEGIICGECSLQPGILTQSDIIACQTSDQLKFTVEKTFPDNTYNPSTYNYGHVIFKDSTILDYQDMIDMTSFDAGVYTICGIQYAKIQSTLLPPKLSRFSPETFRNLFFQQGACIALTDSCFTVQIEPQTSIATVTAVICNGDSYKIGDQEFKLPGKYLATIENGICDSLVELNLSVLNIQGDIVADRDSLTCNGNTIALLGSNVGNPVSDVQYFWYTNDGQILSSDVNFFVVDIVKEGTYFLEITGTTPQLTCKDTISKVIYRDETFPKISFAADTITCFVDTVLIQFFTNLPTIEANWSSKEGHDFQVNSQGIDVWKPGTYFLTVKGENSCSSTDSITIFEDKLGIEPTFSADTITCLKEIVKGNLEFQIDRPYRFLWEGSAFNSTVRNPNFPNPGVYKLTATDLINGCETVRNFEVIGDLTPVGVINFVVDTIDCNKTSVTPSFELTAPVSEYSWMSGINVLSMDSTYTFMRSGSYSLELISTGNGCNSKFDFTIIKDTLVPSLVLSAGLLSCDPDTTTIEVLSGPILNSYTWMGPGIIDNNLSPKVIRSGFYTIQFVAENGCRGQQFISVLNSIDVPDTRFKLDSIRCGKDTLQVEIASASAVFEYEWSGPNVFMSDLATPKISEAGDYSVTITNAISGCKVIQDLTIVDDRIYTVAEISAPPLDCVKDSIQISLTNPGIKSILYTGPSFSSTDISPFVKNVGLYEFTLINDKNCVTNGSIEVIRNDTLPVVEPSFESIKCNQDSVAFAGISTLNNTVFQWTGSGGFNKTGDIVYAYKGGNYTLIGTAPNGCSAQKDFVLGYDTLSPVFNILPFDVLTCEKDSTLLSTDFPPEDGTVVWMPGNLTGQSVFVSEAGSYIATLTAKNNCKASQNFEVVEDKTFPKATSTSTVINCKDLTSNVTVIPQSPYKTITWSDSNPSNIADGVLTFNSATSGMYTYTLTNEELCITVDSVEIKTDLIQPIVLDTILDSITCLVPLIKIGVNLEKPGREYLWNGPGVVNKVETSPSLEITEGGTYFLKVTGQNFCTSIISFSVFKNAEAPQFTTFADTLTCDKGKINIGVNPISDITLYHWNGPDMFESKLRSPKVFQAGNYTVTVTGTNGCSSTRIVEVTENVVKPIITIADTIYLPCDTSAINLVVDADLTILKHRWVFPDGSIFSEVSPSTDISGDYSIQVTGLNGCPSQNLPFYVDIDSKPPGFFIEKDTLNCVQKEVTLKAQSLENDVVYQWTNPSGLEVTAPSIKTTVPGDFQLIVSDSNLCKDTITVTITIDTIVPKIVIDTFGGLQCEVNQVVLDASASDQGNDLLANWTTINGNITTITDIYTAELNTPGLYTFTLRNTVNGCVNRKDIAIEKQSPQFTNVVVESKSPSCPEIRNGSIQLMDLNGTSPYRIKFDGVDQNEKTSFDNLWSGIYNLEVIDSFGCVVTKEVNVPQPATTEITFDPQLKINFGESIELRPNIVESEPGRATMLWYQGDSLLCDGCRTLIVKPFVNTVYTLKISYDGFCQEEVKVLVRVVRKLENAIPNIFRPQSDGPNRLFYIPQTLGISMINHIYVFDRWAENVFRASNVLPGEVSKAWDGTFDGKPVAEGVYILVIEFLLDDGSIWKYNGDLTVMR